MADALDHEDMTALWGLLEPAQAVLFDFDVPVCKLFAGRSTADAAERIKRLAAREWGALDADISACTDSHGLLPLLRDMYERESARGLSRYPFEQAERIVARQESEAAGTAEPTADFVAFATSMSALGKRLAIVSNNAEDAIRAYLERPDLQPMPEFEGIFGRDPADARLMKPDPACVVRALKHLSLPASACLLVGDKPSDLKAARAAGTCFLGFTQKLHRAEEMREDGAEAVISSYLPALEVAGTLRAVASAR